MRIPGPISANAARVLSVGAPVVLRLGIGGVFLVSALDKLQQPYDFLWALYDYEIAGPAFGLAIASVLPWLELLLGVSLIAGTLERGAWTLSVVVLTAFTCAKASVLARGLKIPCGCVRTPRSGVIDVSDLVITAILLAAAVAGLVFSLVRSPRLADGSDPAVVHGNKLSLGENAR